MAEIRQKVKTKLKNDITKHNIMSQKLKNANKWTETDLLTFKEILIEKQQWTNK